MPVDPKKTRKVLVVHGVETGTNADLHQDELINDLIKTRLENNSLKWDCLLYKYENINDEAQSKFKILIDFFVKNPIGQKLSEEVLDLVGDVVISLENDETANTIREGLKQTILEIYEEGSPCYIVAHSLGTIYTFDVLNQLIADDQYFNRDSRRAWPVQGLLTIGSPIGLQMFKITGRDHIQNFGPGKHWFRWINIWDHNDPVVSGNIFGAYTPQYKIAEDFLSKDPDQGWVVRDIPVDTGKFWLMAHTAYWHSPVVGDKLVDMVSS